MTELERALLDGLKTLESDYKKQLTQWREAFSALAEQQTRTQQENAILSKQVNGLANQVESLQSQLQSDSQHVQSLVELLKSLEVR